MSTREGKPKRKRARATWDASIARGLCIKKERGKAKRVAKQGGKEGGGSDGHHKEGATKR